jgi:hypothetical protein
VTASRRFRPALATAVTQLSNDRFMFLATILGCPWNGWGGRGGRAADMRHALTSGPWPMAGPTPSVL